MKLAIVAIALALSLLAASPASAQDELISIDSIALTTGSSTTLDVNVLNIHAPGLGAWNIGVEYDPSILTAVSCGSTTGSKCNVAFTAQQVLLVGARAAGLTGDNALASITFNCDQAGVSDLVIKVSVFSDATAGALQPLSFMLQNGRIICSDPMPEAPPLLGDADCSGHVDSRDALLVLQFEAGLIDSLPCQNLADVNRDGRVNSVDAGLIKQIDAGLLVLT